MLWRDEKCFYWKLYYANKKSEKYNSVNITMRLLTKFALVFSVLVRFDEYYYNVALFSTDFIDLEVKATLFKELYSVVHLFISS